MRTLLNKLLRCWIRISLHFYFGGIYVHGRDTIPTDKPMLLVANHQNALLDALLIATQLGLKPYFLARFDVFKNKWIARLLNLLQLLPVYRMRDGIDKIPKNQGTFERCAKLLAVGKSILIFPEGNHNLERNLRPLSKGFTRILFGTLSEYPELPLEVLPVGINYAAHQYAGTRVSLIVGKSLPVRKNAFNASLLKEQVANSLKALTFQLPSPDYRLRLDELLTSGVDLTDPLPGTKQRKPTARAGINGRPFLLLLYFPLVLLWLLVKPRINDPVFYGTFKFIIGLLGTPVYLASLGGMAWLLGQPLAGLFLIIGMVLALECFRYSPKQF